LVEVVPKYLNSSTCMPSVMVEIRYAGVERAAGCWGNLV